MKHKTMRAGVLMFGALALVACGPETGAGFGAITPVTTAATATPGAMEQEAQIIALINAERARQGRSPLSYNAALTTAAQWHTGDLAARNGLSHTGRNGSTVGDRVRAAGYSYCYVSENLSVGYPSAQQAVQGWMQSKGHRANLLNGEVQDVGIGIGPNNLFVAVFAKPCR
ncbi:CAP domain-containing protein [Celeribacter persicus]|nr:CAP domain-containing protein [Celeribacter persicus]